MAAKYRNTVTSPFHLCVIKSSKTYPMNNVLFSSISLAELKEIFTAVVRQELLAKSAEEAQERFLSPKETCCLFSPKVSLVTLNAWANKGLLNKHYIGARTYYKQVEVMEAVKLLKKYQRVHRGLGTSRKERC